MRYEALGKFKDHFSKLQEDRRSPETLCASLSNLPVHPRVNDVESGSIRSKKKRNQLWNRVDPALMVSTPILAPVQISKKQTVVGSLLFFIIANFKSFKQQYHCAKPHAGKAIC